MQMTVVLTNLPQYCRSLPCVIEKS